jgi:hypothetical protein
VNIANKFYRRTQFQKCIGVLDGKHIGIKMSAASKSLFCNNNINNKNFFSVVFLASESANYCFIAVDFVEVGKSSESNVFKNPNRKETGFESTVKPKQQSVAYQQQWEMHAICDCGCRGFRLVRTCYSLT